MNNNDIIKYFSNLIESELGIVYNENNLYQLQNRLEEYIQIVGIQDLETLYNYAFMNDVRFNKEILLELATNNETTFFRDVRVFNGIKKLFENVLEEKKGTGDGLKIWCAATSTGQEVISLSILLEEILNTHKLQVPYSILCSDISQKVLKRAQEGVYTEFEVSRGLEQKYLDKYFTHENRMFKFSPQILSKMRFVKQNLKKSFTHLGQFDFVFCRNVLIYQKVESKIEVLNRLSESVVPRGYLVLGAGESLLGLSNDFNQELVEGAVFYRKK